MYMKNQMWVWIVLLVIILGGAYMYRSQIKSMLMGGSYSAAPAPVTQTTESVSPQTTGAAAAGTNLVMTKTDAAKGDYLVGPTGMTLYIFDKDTAGVSNCSGACATLWPPYVTTSAPATMPANMTTITRADGTIQFAYKGKPVYYYQKDVNPGDTTGDGFGGIWHLVKP